jgi:hypothetical protein
MRKAEIEEGLGELADIAERDHEVQMARAQLYKSAKYSIKLHEMLKNVSEADGLEGWIQSKITKASEMLGSVYHHLDYENSPMSESQKDTHCKDECCGSDIKREDCECPPNCKHCNCNDDSIPEEKTYKEQLHAKLEGKFKSAAHRKAVHAGKASGKRKK